MDRRAFLAAALTGASTGLRAAEPVTRPIGLRTGAPQPLPLIGMGTWQTFDVGPNPAALERRRQVLRHFFEAGGGVIDSSPMYGRAERVVGELLPRDAVRAGKLFAATKVWTPFDASGAEQHADSLALWKLARLDLQQVHNLLNTAAHLKTLRAARDRGEVRFLGATTSHGRRHDEMLALVRREPLDAIQLTYNLADTSAEPLIAEAATRGIAVIVNRPFDGGALPRRLEGKPLPGWARDIDAAGWPQLLLKWVVSHPGVTCAIPATGDPAHMLQNMAAGRGRLPDAALRRRIEDAVRALV
ncbi:MAG TPA: aldo/keto reductase [Methylibium sp.]|uniref:aldo/keto reductase n=1 Tax=Methylibium sp. TaxID=2067992 RepID=UPI002DB9500D|nr:aldo/keto reductase [Methylibium sp.]HEU4460405.1 aldo/keto reductase [Methylibium sp.]